MEILGVDNETRSGIERAHNRIRPFIHKTPVLTSGYFDSVTGSSLYFKCENLQKTGSFKIRGVMNTLLQLTEEERQNGVAAHSSGNHAQALAYGAKILQIPAYLVMPKNSSKIKVDAVREYGGIITFCEPNDQAREQSLHEIINSTGAHMVHPYDAFFTIEGQSTAAKELAEELTAPLDFIVTPVGGGGLLAGSVLSAKLFSPGTKVIGAEPELARDAFESFAESRIVSRDNSATIADGLRTNLGKLTFGVIIKNADQILLVSENEIVRAMKQFWERMKIIIEPSSAVPLAAVLKYPDLFHGKRTGIIITGGNIDLSGFPIFAIRP